MSATCRSPSRDQDLSTDSSGPAGGDARDAVVQVFGRQTAGEALSPPSVEPLAVDEHGTFQVQNNYLQQQYQHAQDMTADSLDAKVAEAQQNVLGDDREAAAGLQALQVQARTTSGSVLRETAVGEYLQQIQARRDKSNHIESATERVGRQLADFSDALESECDERERKSHKVARAIDVAIDGLREVHRFSKRFITFRYHFPGSITISKFQIIPNF